MKALILRQDPEAACAVSRALMDKGFQILCVEKLDVAHALIRVDTIDLLVMDERIDGQLTHSIALSGERKAPFISTILFTDRDRDETDDLYLLIPSLYALVGSTVDAYVVGRLALAAVSNTEDVMARVTRQQAIDDYDQSLPPLVLHDAEPRYAASVSDDEDSPADLAIALPEMAEIRREELGAPPERLDEVIMAEVAAILRADGFAPQPRSMPRLARPEEVLEVVGGAV
ncbi:hypothetical protein [Yoonia litorea]|uniref:Response regulatory domain-containing protein n=1 Tax=Yoonia litorea TaxID=1123755 RepID=A0A1I6MG97_9RHOB|nr:hypothetical protein [Yoonia litorea]SFS14607.1 hypothetical protein SAMN05444714_1723 [Yoonia litorea]